MSISRKDFLKQSSLATAAAFVVPAAVLAADPIRFKHVQLTYAPGALEPFIDKMTMEIHHGKHYAAYVTNANDALAAENISSETAASLFAGISKFSPKLRNNAGGAWNHEQFWTWMKPGGQAIPGILETALNGAFGSVDAFKTAFAKEAMGRFGSGWAWLIKTPDGKLAVTSTPNQDNPMMDAAAVKGTPLLGLDVWEHAYYLKYQNKRADYISGWWNIVNWDAAAAAL